MARGARRGSFARASRPCVPVLILVVCLASARVAGAQATAQIPLQFDFLTPGARSMGTGGAFVGASDDATAAFTNPSGLAFLTTREISAEGRYRRFETPFLARGRVSGEITGQGADTLPLPVYGQDVDTQFGPAFMSVVVPFRAATVTAYRHELVRLENTFLSEGVFEQATLVGSVTNEFRDPPLAGERRVRMSNYGAAVGYKLTPVLAIGGGMSIYHFTLSSAFKRLGLQSTVFSPPDPTLVTATATQTGDDVSASVNAGLLWKVSNRIQIGATIRRGPQFAFTQKDRVPSEGFDLVRTGTFKVPNVGGVGLQWRMTENVRVLADYNRVQYSDLRHDFIDFQTLASDRPGQIRLDNGNEWHGGVEYQFLRLATPLAFRAGVWYDPDHAPRYVSTPKHDEVDVLFGATLPGGKNLVHYTFGAGAVLAQRIELNGAADVSSRTTYATTSVVIRF